MIQLTMQVQSAKVENGYKYIVTFYSLSGKLIYDIESEEVFDTMDEAYFGAYDYFNIPFPSIQHLNKNVK